MFLVLTLFEINNFENFLMKSKKIINMYLYKKTDI